MTVTDYYTQPEDLRLGTDLGLTESRSGSCVTSPGSGC
jgi:hypothetical protein